MTLEPTWNLSDSPLPAGEGEGEGEVPTQQQPLEFNSPRYLRPSSELVGDGSKPVDLGPLENSPKNKVSPDAPKGVPDGGRAP